CPFINRWLRIVPGLRVALALMPRALGPTAPVLADAPDPRDPDRRIVIVLKSVYVSDDHDWWGTGEMEAMIRFYRTNDGCGPGQAEPPTCEELLASLVVDFPANDGDNVPLNRAMPATGPGANVADPSMIGPEIGIPVWNNRFYRLGLRLDEVDGRLFDELG